MAYGWYSSSAPREMPFPPVFMVLWSFQWGPFSVSLWVLWIKQAKSGCAVITIYLNKTKVYSWPGFTVGHLGALLLIVFTLGPRLKEQPHRCGAGQRGRGKKCYIVCTRPEDFNLPKWVTWSHTPHFKGALKCNLTMGLYREPERVGTVSWIPALYSNLIWKPHHLYFKCKCKVLLGFWNHEAKSDTYSFVLLDRPLTLHLSPDSFILIW